MLQKLGTHQFATVLAFDQLQRLNDVIMRKKPQNRNLLVDVPDYHALVVRA